MLPSYVRPSHNHASGWDFNRGGASCLAAPCCWWRGPQRSQGRAVFPDYISCLMGQALVPPGMQEANWHDGMLYTSEAAGHPASPPRERRGSLLQKQRPAPQAPCVGRRCVCCCGPTTARHQAQCAWRRTASGSPEGGLWGADVGSGRTSPHAKRRAGFARRVLSLRRPRLPLPERRARRLRARRPMQAVHGGPCTR